MNDQQIMRCRRENPFVQLDKNIADNPSLSMQAKGLLLYIFSKPENWIVRVNDVVKQMANGRDAVLSTLRELKKHGYLVLEKVIDEKRRIVCSRYRAYEMPLDTPLEGGRVFMRMNDGTETLLEELVEAKPSKKSTPLDKKENSIETTPETDFQFVETIQEVRPDPVYSVVEFPQTGFPDTDFPDRGNPTLNKNEYSNNEFNKKKNNFSPNSSFIPSPDLDLEKEENERGIDGDSVKFPEIEYAYLEPMDDSVNPRLEEIKLLIRRLWGKKRLFVKDETLYKKEIRGLLSHLTWRHIQWVLERFDNAARERDILNVSGYLSSLIIDSCTSAENTWDMPMPGEVL